MTSPFRLSPTAYPGAVGQLGDEVYAPLQDFARRFPELANNLLGRSPLWTAIAGMYPRVGDRLLRGIDRFAARFPAKPPASFGRSFLRRASALLNEKLDLDETLEMLRAFEPLAGEQLGPPAEAFWSALAESARMTTEARRKQGVINTAWGTTPILTIAAKAKADHLLGANAQTIVFTNYYTFSSFDLNLKGILREINNVDCNLGLIFRRLALAWALLEFDVFHLFNDQGFDYRVGGYGSNRFGISIFEMDIYKGSGKALFTYAYGADHRMRNKVLKNGALNICMDCSDPGRYCLCDEATGERVLSEIKRRATCMLGFGLSVDHIPWARRLNYLVLEPSDYRPCYGFSQSPQPLRVGHFPNHGFFKGTVYLEKAIDDLRAEKVPIELVKLSGVPQSAIVEAMRSVDVVVDQLISGSIGLTAIEAMALGRPVIAHIRDGVALPDLPSCPVIRATPDTIGLVLRGLAEDRSDLPTLHVAAADMSSAICRSTYWWGASANCIKIMGLSAPAWLIECFRMPARPRAGYKR